MLNAESKEAVSTKFKRTATSLNLSEIKKINFKRLSKTLEKGSMRFARPIPTSPRPTSSRS